MSTLKADLLQNRLGTNAPAVTKGEFVTHSIQANGTTAAIIASFNVSSTTDTAVGQRTITYATPRASGWHAVVCGLGQGTPYHIEVVNNSSSAHNCWSWTAGNVYGDVAYIYEIGTGGLGMSNLVSTYIQDRASGIRFNTDVFIDGTPKAWINFDGTTNAIRTSFGVSTLTDVGAGQWYPTYSSPFKDAWSLPSGCAHHAGVFWAFLSMIPSGNATSLWGCNMATPTTPSDCNYVSVSTCGRLA